jgi:hypothetical protein
MLSKEKLEKIAKLTAETFSQGPQSDMLNFFMEMREKQKTGSRAKSEKWVQMEIARKFYREGKQADPREHKKKSGGYDFKIDDVSMELKTSGTFTYEGASDRLLDEIKNHKKHPNCWMFVTVLTGYEEKEADLNRKLASLDYYHTPPQRIRNTNPEWCVILTCKKSEIES